MLPARWLLLLALSRTPLRGAWIEIAVVIVAKEKEKEVAPRSGVRGLKSR